jgi:hypothetical protein
MKIMIRLEPPAYRFPLAMPGTGVWIDLYEIEIYESEEEIVVVMRDHPEAQTTSITNNVHNVATEIHLRFLRYLYNTRNRRIRWIEHYPKSRNQPETWDEVTFDSGPPYSGPHWRSVKPVHFDWDSAVSPNYSEHEYVQVVAQEHIAEDTFWFDKGECHRISTGCCSLDPSAKPDDGTGENGYSYCRGLAKYALLWHHMLDYFKEHGGIPKTWDRDEVPEGLLEHVKKFTSDFGELDEVERDVNRAWELYSPNSNRPLKGSSDMDGKIYFSDGRHRICIHNRLNLPLYARITVREPRTHSQT